MLELARLLHEAGFDDTAEALVVALEAGQGLLVHTAGFDDDNGVWRLVDVWETREKGERFMQRMMEMVTPEELPRPDAAAQRPTRESYYELHDFVKH